MSEKKIKATGKLDNSMDIPTEAIEIPTLAMRGMVMFPNMILHFDVAREKSIRALHASMNADRKIFLVAQKDALDEDVEVDNLYKIGVVAEIRQIVRSENDRLRVVVEGLYRAKVIDFTEDTPFLISAITHYPLKRMSADKESIEAKVRILKDSFSEYGDLSPTMPNELLSEILLSDDAVELAEFIAGNMQFGFVEKQKILEESQPFKRLDLLIDVLSKEVEILKIEIDIQEKVRTQMDKNQRDYYLREQIKALKDELNGGDSEENEIEAYRKKIRELKLDKDSEEKLLKQIDKLEFLSINSQEGTVIRTQLDSILEIPFNKFTKDRIDVEKARKILDKDHYGLKRVKERILETLAVKKMAGDTAGQIICLLGPPGIGKTSIARSVAEAMGKKYVRLSLGGVRDEADIRGHRKTYLGAMPGRIIASLKQAQSLNPLMLLDEIDKLGSDHRGDPSAAMLEVLDSEQNKAFRDHYIEIPVDLSQVFFIATANNRETIPPPLLDRMEIIELTSYTREEKFHICKNHLIPKQIKKHGILSQQLSIENNAIYGIIDNYTREAGVRTLERMIAKICRKCDMKFAVKDAPEKIKIKAKDLSEYLGTPRFKDDEKPKEDLVGIANGLAWTSVGGEMLQAEVAVLNGKGENKMTGSLGDVMKESVSTAVTCIRSRTGKYGIDNDFYKTKDIHIHFPEGAVPKDGPSAGITICTAMVSALTDIPVRHDVAMTGEITLRGNVLPIGGLREKTMAAYKQGMKKVIIPFANIPDLDEVEDIVKENIEFIPAKTIDTVLKNALCKLPNNDQCKAVSEEKTVVIKEDRDSKVKEYF